MVDLSMRMSFIEYAKHIGMSKQYVSKIFLEGRLRKAILLDEKGKTFIDSDIADKLLKGDESEIHEDINTRPENVEDQYEDDRILNSSYDEAKRIKICLEAISEKIKIDKERKILLPADVVHKEAENAALVLREKLLIIPSQLASDLSKMTSSFDIKNLLAESIANVLEEFSNMCLSAEESA